MNLKALHNHFISHPESRWIMQYSNAVDLYNFIKNNPIKRVLGLGTGVGFSDAVVALAWKDKGVEGELDSLEQYDKCIKLAGKLIPDELNKYIKIHKVNPTTFTSDKMPYQILSVYDQIPDNDYDLIINDGPSPFLDSEGNFAELPNGTIQQMTIDGKIKPNTFVIYDGRVSSLSILERYLGENFYLVKIPPRGSDFVILQKKDCPLIVKDERLKGYQKNSTYFKNHEKDSVSGH